MLPSTYVYLAITFALPHCPKFIVARFNVMCYSTLRGIYVVDFHNMVDDQCSVFAAEH